ncbi:MAG: SCO1664 family protein [Chloroflexi bacterium]|nr:SCO1664 family protein [Chloroflexota bacterium]
MKDGIPENPTIQALQEGKLSLQGEFLWGSNYTYLVQAEIGGAALRGVYKPTRGVRPLWDFPAPTLARRETAAYLLDEALGWRLVPPTVFRADAPLGPGSVQLFIEHNPENHYFNLSAENRQRLRPAALFDLLSNNADRKGSHVLLDEQEHIWLIDHGLCFHMEEKLRTVIWDFAGEPFPAPLRAGLEALLEALHSRGEAASPLNQALRRHLSSGEVGALARRAERLLASGCFPTPDSNRRQYPWPPV